MTARIRPAADGDFAAIAAITNHYVEDTAIHFAFDVALFQRRLADGAGAP